MTANWKNKTIWTADNLDIMRGMNSESVDLIYLDPPFNKNQMFSAPIGSEAAGAHFKDAWTLNDVDRAWMILIAEKKEPLHSLIHTIPLLHGESMQAYLIYMAIRLLEMHRILKATGSFYLHCDPTASHYLKLLLDVIFGHHNFRNEIVWFYRRWSATANQFQRMHDIILYYGKTDRVTFNRIYVETSTTRSEMKRGYNTNTYMTQGIRKRQIIIEDQDKFDEAVAKGEVDLSQFERVIQRKSEGTFAFDVFQIPIINPQSKERTGYPTQKPLALLERIVLASSNVDEIVFDPFCGCATTCVAAYRHDRQWAGIDLSERAVDLVRARLEKEQKPMFNTVIKRIDIPQRTDQGEIPNYRTHKDMLYGKQGGDCNGCRVHFQKRNLVIDHIIPRARGGTDHIDNLQLLCGNCNSLKSVGTHEELIVKLKKHHYLT